MFKGLYQNKVSIALSIAGEIADDESAQCPSSGSPENRDVHARSFAALLYHGVTHHQTFYPGTFLALDL